MGSAGFRKAWAWYAWYCAANALLNAGLTTCALVVVARSQELQAEWFGEQMSENLPPWFLTMIAGALGSVAAVFVVSNLLLLRAPRNKAWWAAHLINIVLGLGSGLFTLPCVALFVMWIRPEVKAAFETAADPASFGGSR
jgi:hypothetical protein